MRKLFKYFIIAGSIVLASCSVDDAYLHDAFKEGYIEFVPNPTSFEEYNVSSKSTKAAPSETRPSELDSRIESAYFLVFGADGERKELRRAAVKNNSIVPETLYHNSKNGPLTVCYLVNVRESYADSLDNFSKLSQKEYAYKINYAKNEAESNLLGIPVLNGVQCFPMIGVFTQSYENGQLSGMISESNGKFQMPLPIKRLFAKVYFEIKWDTQTNTGNLLGDQGFKQNRYILNNLPKYVLLDELGAGSESKWVKDDSYFMDPIVVDKSQETSLLRNIEFTVYIPEYALLPESEKVEEVNNISGITDAEKQKYKPLLYDTSKNPVYLVINGIVQSTDFVDVPVAYSVYLGENAFDSFSLIRNNQYNNKMTIYGTGDAILGKDDRVEALYHNLADPNNTGTDNPANCYIIGRPGRYLIPTYKGNSSEMLGGIDISKKVIYSDGKNSIGNMKFIPDSVGKNWVMFDVNMTIVDNSITALPAIEDGNTVLEFKDSSGNTIWSWHLWFTSGGMLGSEWGAISSETYSGTNATMMNRNIGAAQAGSVGMYYTWGDKDPYFKPSGKSAAYYGNTIADSWSGGTKQVTDPCPPGYMVPSRNVWLGETAWKGTTAGADGAQLYSGSGFFYDLNDPNVIYPFSSYLKGSTKVIHPKSDWSDEKTNNNFGTIYYKDRYSLVDGLLWTSTENTSLYYGVKKMEAQVTRAKYGSLTIDPSSWLWKYVSGMVDKFVEWFISKDKSVYENPNSTTKLDASSGLQVRCVREDSITK